MLGAEVNCIPKAGNVLDPLLGLKCSQHWKWKAAPLPVLRAQLVCPGYSHRSVPKHSFLQHAFQIKIQLQNLKDILDL